MHEDLSPVKPLIEQLIKEFKEDGSKDREVLLEKILICKGVTPVHLFELLDELISLDDDIQFTIAECIATYPGLDPSQLVKLIDTYFLLHYAQEQPLLNQLLRYQSLSCLLLQETIEDYLEIESDLPKIEKVFDRLLNCAEFKPDFIPTAQHESYNLKFVLKDASFEQLELLLEYAFEQACPCLRLRVLLDCMLEHSQLDRAIFLPFLDKYEPLRSRRRLSSTKILPLDGPFIWTKKGTTVPVFALKSRSYFAQRVSQKKHKSTKLSY